MENQDTKILWNFITRTDCVIEARRLDIVLIDKKSHLCLYIRNHLYVNYY